MPDVLNNSSASPTHVFSVSELNRQVRMALENAFSLLWVSGEISNLTYASSGHVYFSLKDAGAQVRCAMWRNRAQLLGWRLENGQQVEVRALVGFYEPRGEFQLNVEAVRRAGQGDLFRRFVELKAKLDAEGLFSPERKRPLPTFPRSIALVTSPQAAALRDVITTFQRRAPHLTLTLYPTPVQGAGAGERIAAALQLAGAGAHDLILLCRGGGSIEDLWAFNEECVARAIVAAPIPVICGVGHETDFTIADFAADLRAPTPTAGAELSSPDRSALQRRLDESLQRLSRAARHTTNTAGQRLDWINARLLHPAQQIRGRRDAAERLGERLGTLYRTQLAQQGHQLTLTEQRLRAARPHIAKPLRDLQQLAERLHRARSGANTQLRARLEHLESSLRQLDPHAVLGRGYALARNAAGEVIRDATQLSRGDRLQVQFAQGSVAAEVTQVAASPEAD